MLKTSKKMFWFLQQKRTTGFKSNDSLNLFLEFHQKYAKNAPNYAVKSALLSKTRLRIIFFYFVMDSQGNIMKKVPSRQKILPEGTKNVYLPVVTN